MVNRMDFFLFCIFVCLFSRETQFFFYRFCLLFFVFLVSIKSTFHPFVFFFVFVSSYIFSCNLFRFIQSQCNFNDTPTEAFFQQDSLSDFQCNTLFFFCFPPIMGLLFSNLVHFTIPQRKERERAKNERKIFSLAKLS